MAGYPKNVMDKFLSPMHAGEVAGANAVGRAVSFECGSLVSVSLRISDDSGRVEAAGFRTSGCVYIIAAAEAAAEYLTGRELRSLHLAEEALDLAAGLGPLPSERVQCVSLARDAVAAAFAEYRKNRVSEYSGEAALICTCFGVTEERIEEVLGDPAVRDTASVAAVCNAGSGCGSCRMLIQEMIDARLAGETP